jgi:hypothetical protein
MRSFATLVESGKEEILRLLASGPLQDKDLQPRVLNWINIKILRDETVKHETLSVHCLAYIIAYKQLEQEGQIKISRPPGVPFPMTDYKTTFGLVQTEQELAGSPSQ